MKNKGITLIALVITIVVLIILAAVAINLSLGNNGIFNRAKTAKEKYTNSQIEEWDMLNNYDFIIGNRSFQESSIIENFTIEVLEETGNAIVAKVNTTADNASRIKGYMYVLNNKVYGIKNDTQYTYCNLQTGSSNDIMAIAVDENGDFKKSNIVKQQMSNRIKTRYIIFEVFDHIASDGVSIGELEVYNSSNNKISYTLTNAYDSTTKSLPSHWNGAGGSYSTNYWSKDNLYDGQIAYSSNAVGRGNCVYLIGDGTPNAQNYVRILIDLGSTVELGKVKVAIGDNEQRTPKSLSIYTIPNTNYNGTTSFDYNSTYYNNLYFRSNENISLKHTEEFTATVATPTWYEF